MEGGAPILITLKINHQKVIAGKNIIKPFINISLRVKNRSYIIFAAQNKAEEHKPCPNIKIITPYLPHNTPDSRPPITRLI